MEKTITTTKEKAIDFLMMVASGKIREAYLLYIGNDFIHHNAYFKGDADSLMNAMEENAKTNPDKSLKVLRALADGDWVTVHSHIKQNPQDAGAIVVHIFRFQQNKIAELWDVGMEVPSEIVNENGIF